MARIGGITAYLVNASVNNALRCLPMRAPAMAAVHKRVGTIRIVRIVHCIARWATGRFAHLYINAWAARCVTYGAWFR